LRLVILTNEGELGYADKEAFSLRISMTVVHLPRASESAFRRAFGEDLDRAALEALTVEGYRTGKLSLGEVAKVLELETTIAAQEWLADRDVSLNYSLSELEADRATLWRVLGARKG
jgi:predicted HTH domain antitoxin